MRQKRPKTDLLKKEQSLKTWLLQSFLNLHSSLTVTLKRPAQPREIAGDKNAKKGDFVLTEKDTNKKIVIEAKNLSKDPTTKQILEYSMAAINNRGADYCVYLYYDSDDTSIPDAGMFNEVAKNVLFVVVSESDSYDANTRMIRLGWQLGVTKDKSRQ